ASAIKSGLPMPFTSISAGWIFTLMGLLDDGRPLNQGKSQKIFTRFTRLKGKLQPQIRPFVETPGRFHQIAEDTLEKWRRRFKAGDNIGLQALDDFFCQDTGKHQATGFLC
ncbi:hypothetical protein, partial [Thiolapillus sp.]|uniref:hypothetical protein n=1 Tax=Thiolapillus sp. TaxID=2017437 RepID=UPI0025D4CE05